MTVFGYAELMPKAKLRAAGAHRVFERMEDLLDLSDGRYAHIMSKRN